MDDAIRIHSVSVSVSGSGSGSGSASAERNSDHKVSTWQVDITRLTIYNNNITHNNLTVIIDDVFVVY